MTMTLAGLRKLRSGLGCAAAVAVLASCGATPPPEAKGEFKQSISSLTPCGADNTCPQGSRCEVLIARTGEQALCFGPGQTPCDYLACPEDYPSCFAWASLPAQWTCVRHGP